MVHSKLKFKGGAGSAGGGGGSADGGGHGDELSDEEVMTQILQLQLEDEAQLQETIQKLQTQIDKRTEEIGKINKAIYDENSKRIGWMLARDDTNKETSTRRIKALKTLLNQKLTAISVLVDEINKLVPKKQDKPEDNEILKLLTKFLIYIKNTISHIKTELLKYFNTHNSVFKNTLFGKQKTAGGRTRHRNTRSSKKRKNTRTKKYRR